MKITCPKCGHTAEVDKSVIPTGASSVRCNACGARFPLARESERSVENGTGLPFRCPVCGAGQERGDACRECGLVFDSFTSGNLVHSAMDGVSAMTSANAPHNVAYGNNRSSRTPFLRQVSIRKYLFRFAASYVGLMITAGIIVSALHIKKASGLNTGIFLGTVVWALGAFAGDHGRLWNANEKWRLTFGFLLISLSFDLIPCVVALPTDASTETIVLALVFSMGFIGLIRFFALLFFMGPMAIKLFGKGIIDEA